MGAQVFRKEGGGGEHDRLRDRAARHEAPAGERHRDRPRGKRVGPASRLFIVGGGGGGDVHSCWYSLLLY